MKRAKRSLAVAVLLIATSHLAADSFKSLLKEFEETTGEFVDVLKRIKDNATANAALPKVKLLVEKRRDIAKRMNQFAELKPGALGKDDTESFQKFLKRDRAFTQEI